MRRLSLHKDDPDTLEWSMSIPAKENDPDIVIYHALDGSAQRIAYLEDIVSDYEDLLDWIDAVCEGTPKQPFLDIKNRIKECTKNLGKNWGGA